MYEFLVLGKLCAGPMHGYMIARIIGNIMGPFRRVQWGTLYPVLNRLEAEGLIRAVDDTDRDGRARKVYAITEAGKRRLHELLMDTEQHLGEYDTLFPHKVTLFSVLTAQERLYLGRHYAVYAQQNIDHLLRKRRDILANDHLDSQQKDNIASVMDHRIEYWEHECAWAEELISQQTAREAV